MEDGSGILLRKNVSEPSGKHCAPTRPKPDTHKAIRHTKSFNNIRVSPTGRHAYDPVGYNDVFGGPPRCVSSRSIADEPPAARRSYDDVFKVFEKELNSNRGYSNLPVFELPVYEISSFPVFELPVFGGPELPVFGGSASRDDLGSRGTTPKSSVNEFYDDIFSGGGGHSASGCEESTKSLFSRPSRSRSMSSSPQLSTKDPSPHHAEDNSLSALASKLGPIALSSEQSRSFISGPSGTQQMGYQSQGSDNVSVVSSTCSSPSQFFSDSASVPSFRFNKPRVFSNRMGRRNTDDVFGGFPRQRHFTHMHSCQKTEDSINELKFGIKLGNVDRTTTLEKYHAVLNTSRKNSVKPVFEVFDASAPSDQTDMADVGLATEPTKEASLPIDTVHLMTQNLLDSSPSKHPTGPQKVKSWRDWVPALKNAPFSPKRDSTPGFFMCNSYVSPITEASTWAQEETKEASLDSLERNSLDDGESSDVLGSYVIEFFSDRRNNLIVPNKNDNNAGDSSIPDASDIAIKEAIAWAKEKYQSGSCKEEKKQDARTSVQGANDKDVLAQMGDENTEGLRQSGNDTSMNGEGRKHKAGNENLLQGSLERSENHGEGLINQSGHSSESDDQLIICKKEIDQHPQETELCPLAGQRSLIDVEEKLIKEVSNDVTIDNYNQHTVNQDNENTLLSMLELDDIYAMGTTSNIVSGGGAKQMDFFHLLEEWASYELERWNVDAQSVDCQTSQCNENCTAAASFDAEAAIVKEIPQSGTTQSDQQCKIKHTMGMEVNLTCTVHKIID